MGHKRKPFYTPQPTAGQYSRDRKRAREAVGHPLKRSQRVHHHSLTQLVICEDQAYHMLLHRRTVAVRFGYNPNVHAACYCCQKPYPVDNEQLTRKFCPMCRYVFSPELGCCMREDKLIEMRAAGFPERVPDITVPEPTWGGKTREQLEAEGEIFWNASFPC